MQNNNEQKTHLSKKEKERLLEQAFMTDPYPTKLERQELAYELDSPLFLVSRWFCARRTRYKKEIEAFPQKVSSIHHLSATRGHMKKTKEGTINNKDEMEKRFRYIISFRETINAGVDDAKMANNKRADECNQSEEVAIIFADETC
ncbi:Oidioi.mRNA.OKI2018_I69.chr2.g5982.t1.cds [Oikopleura dioica]|uniref:Oidioi.mRNA.OKI2018_I69.chr2.g5982.t1.cds n=1 Tax=Oikopleura dioica TaxID=34765 RepID=A0ABN7T590_OIKDI|nr:Oidioi.mRNA.OKI2018_I69.chr2.g5982.t1.cds [Oikopleura dioica]